MQTFDQAIFDLYKQGRITYDNTLINADSVNDLRLKIKLDKIGDEKVKTMPKEKFQSTLKVRPDAR